MNVVTEQIADRHRHDVTGSAAAASAGSRAISASSLNPMGMDDGTICATTVRTEAGAHWLQTPKFGPHHHFQRWRSAT